MGEPVTAYLCYGYQFPEATWEEIDNLEDALYEQLPAEAGRMEVASFGFVADAETARYALTAAYYWSDVDSVIHSFDYTEADRLLRTAVSVLKLDVGNQKPHWFIEWTYH